MTRPLSSRIWALAALGSLVSLTGCGAGSPATSAAGTLAIRGITHGGQQGVSVSTVKLYAAGRTGNGSAATSMLMTPVTTDANGFFTLTEDYTCANAEDQVYLSSTGGNPGLAPGTDNLALVMITALGRCADLPNTAFVNINELTTVAAAWTLAPFIGSAANIGANSTNAAGIRNGFLNAKLLVDPTTGVPPVLTSNLVVETEKLYALANSISSCVNSDGGAGCSPLFAAATVGAASAPTDTLAAVLNVVRNPANNVTPVFNAGSTFAPFPVLLGSAPNDWTMSLTVSGGGLNQPTALAIDAGGYVWVADNTGLLSGFTPQGVPLSSTGFGAGVLSDSFGLTIDTGGSVWVTSANGPAHASTFGAVSSFMGSASGSPGTLIGTFYDANLDYPEALSADTNGDIMIADYGNSTVSLYDINGNVVSSNLGMNFLNFPVAIAADSTHGFWVANQSDNTVSHIAADGTVLAHPNCCNSATGIAVDALGNAWVANYSNSSVSEVSATGAVTLSNIQGGGLSSPAGVAIDGAQDVWVPNYLGRSFTHLAGNGGTSAAGTFLSPGTGFGRDASLSLPFAIATDATGDVWVSSYANNHVVEFFGLASPTKTPVSPTPAIP